MANAITFLENQLSRKSKVNILPHPTRHRFWPTQNLHAIYKGTTGDYMENNPLYCW